MGRGAEVRELNVEGQNMSPFENRRPNLLLVTNDQHRHDFVEGGPVPSLRTPHLARLRREGTTLANAYSACPLCVPTRFTWWYGLRASQGNGAWGEVDSEWPTHLHSLPQRLRQHGYRTAVIGKIHSHSGLHRMDLTACRAGIHARGFDDVFEVAGKSMLKWHDCDYTHYLAERGLLDTYRRRLDTLGAHHTEVLPFAAEHAVDAVICRQACDWLDRAPAEQPFFLHVSFCDPHFPFDPPAEYAARYRPEDMPPPVGIDNPAFIAHHRLVCARYCALIEHCDAQIGRLLDQLDRRGRRDNTAVIFSTDHGDLMGSRGLFGKSEPYAGSARTPITVRFPGRVPAGHVLDAPAESIDLPASILAAAGLDGSPRDLLPGSPGRSWWSYLDGQTTHQREWAFSEMGSWKMVADPNWKFVHRQNGQDELYDLQADPHEQHNLAELPTQRDRVRAMQRRIIASMSEAIAPPSLPTPNPEPPRN